MNAPPSCFRRAPSTAVEATDKGVPSVGRVTLLSILPMMGRARRARLWGLSGSAILACWSSSVLLLASWLSCGSPSSSLF